MTYLQTPFGNGVDVGSGGNVTTSLGAPHNNFGPRIGYGADGEYQVDGDENIYTFEFTGDDINNGVTQLLKTVLPAGGIITRAYAKVVSAFTLGGTTPTILVGTSGSEATNGVSISNANASAVATYALTLNGTWASPLAAATTVNVTLGGTSPTVTSAGRVRVTVHVTNITK